MKDVNGNTLEIDDKVVFTLDGYSDLRRGKVVGFTPKMIKVKVYGEPDLRNRFPNQVSLIANTG